VTTEILTLSGTRGGEPFTLDVPVERPSRFPGDPGPGVILSGSTVISETTVPDDVTWLDDHTSGTKRHALARLYGKTVGGQSNATMDWTRADAQHALGRIPVMSCKYSAFTPTQITSGAADAVLTSEGNQFLARNSWVKWAGYRHEPYDEYPAGSAAASYRAAWRYCVTFWKNMGVTNVAWVGPHSMCDWEYIAAGESSRGGPAYHEDPDWKGTLSGPGGTCSAADWHTGSQRLVDVFAFDTYSPYVTDANRVYRTYQSQFNNMKVKFASWGRPAVPFMIGELGTQDSIPQANWATHWSDLRASALANDVVGYCYFMFGNGGGSSLRSEDPTGVRLAAYDVFFSHPTVLGAP